LASSNSLEGYELLKDVMQSSHDYDNGTLNYSVSVTDNEEELFAFSGEAQGDKTTEEFYVEGIISDGIITKSFEASGNESLVYFRDVENGLIYEIEPDNFNDAEEDYRGRGHDRNDFKDGDYGMTASEERILDALVGDMKNQVTLTELDDGMKEIGLSLSEEDIPLLVNLLVAAAAEHKDDSNEKEMNQADLDAAIALFPFLDGFDCDQEDMPKLVDQVGIVSVDMTIVVDSENEVQGFDFALSIEGKDENDQYHLLTIAASLAGTDMGTTNVDSVEVGTDVIEINESDFDRFNH
jgi:hypothetical protein